MTNLHLATIGRDIRAAAENLAVQIQVDPAPPPGSDKLLTILTWGAWIAFLLCVGGMIAAGVKFAWDKEHGDMGGEGPKRVVKVLGGVAIISGAGGLVGALS